ncbi:hypothetical protein PR202_ga06737 [Eleusine coracana subsp. coracana]|uniref:Uncharacterized protein n=1 Tax=Eleusine coracana subsp. coracana TaxID=191504 RepID=A0AAV5BW51_ELECO|nr:hypothetical protein PR202_ga06737 [Eleusine coracana subsp. coracana]
MEKDKGKTTPYPVLSHRDLVTSWPYPPPAEAEDLGIRSCSCYCSSAICCHPGVLDSGGSRASGKCLQRSQGEAYH